MGVLPCLSLYARFFFKFGLILNTLYTYRMEAADADAAEAGAGAVTGAAAAGAAAEAVPSAAGGGGGRPENEVGTEEAQKKGTAEDGEDSEDGAGWEGEAFDPISVAQAGGGAGEDAEAGAGEQNDEDEDEDEDDDQTGGTSGEWWTRSNPFDNPGSFYADLVDFDGDMQSAAEMAEEQRQQESMWVAYVDEMICALRQHVDDSELVGTLSAAAAPAAAEEGAAAAAASTPAGLAAAADGAGADGDSDGATTTTAPLSGTDTVAPTLRAASTLSSVETVLSLNELLDSVLEILSESIAQPADQSASDTNTIAVMRAMGIGVPKPERAAADVDADADADANADANADADADADAVDASAARASDASPPLSPVMASLMTALPLLTRALMGTMQPVSLHSETGPVDGAPMSPNPTEGAPTPRAWGPEGDEEDESGAQSAGEAGEEASEEGTKEVAAATAAAEKEDGDEDEAAVEAGATTLASVAGLSPRPLVAESVPQGLDVPSHTRNQHLPGELTPRCGLVRVKVAKMVSMLLAYRHDTVNAAVAELGLVRRLWSMFFAHPRNNVLHCTVSRATLEILRGRSAALKAELVEEPTGCGLLRRILEAFAENDALVAAGKARLCYMGQLTEVALEVLGQQEAAQRQAQTVKEAGKVNEAGREEKGAAAADAPPESTSAAADGKDTADAVAAGESAGDDPVRQAVAQLGDRWARFAHGTLVPLRELQGRAIGGPAPAAAQEEEEEEDQSAMLLENLTQILNSLRAQ